MRWMGPYTGQPRRNTRPGNVSQAKDFTWKGFVFMRLSLNELIASELGLQSNQVAGAVELLDAGNTIPFIARYRKEATGGLDETIQEYDPQTGAGTGFKFSGYTPAELMSAVRQALTRLVEVLAPAA